VAPHSQQSLAVVENLADLLSPSLSTPSADSLEQMEDSIVLEHRCLAAFPDPLRVPKVFNLDKPPETLREAKRRPDYSVWRLAMEREYASLQERGVFKPVPLPPGRNMIGLRWTYDYKYEPDGTIIRGKEKGRLVAQGFSQRPEDYGTTYSPVAKMTSIRIVLAFTAFHDYELLTFDVKTAFLNALLPEEIYCKQIPEFPEADPTLALLCLRAIYGLKQASHEFYVLLCATLEALGLVRCEVDKAVFYGRFSSPPDPSIPMPLNNSDLVIIIPVHVDDGLVSTNSIPLYRWVISKMNEKFTTIDQGAAALYLGIRIVRDRERRKIWLSQKPLILELLTTHNLLDAKTSSVPLHVDLASPPKPAPNALPEIADSEIKVHYQRIVGSLLYLAVCTRPDIAFTAIALGQYNSNPTRAHLLAAKGVLRYLLGTLDFALEYNFERDPISVAGQLLVADNCAFMDADWASDATTRRSVSGYTFFLWKALVSWSAVRQRTVALSSTEAEYMSIAHAMREAIWVRLFTTILSLPIPSPLPLLCDNQSALNIAGSEAINSRSKHIDVRHHFVREHLSSGSFATQWIPTGDMTADIMTKALKAPLHEKHCKALGLVRVPS
jgi:hypothetical protein